MKRINDYIEDNPMDENEEFFFRKGIELAQQWTSTKIELPIKGSEYQIIGKTKPSKFGTVRFKIVDIYIWESDYEIKNKMGGYSHWRKIELL